MAHTTHQLRGYCSVKGYRRIDEVLGLLCDLYNDGLWERRYMYERHKKSVSAYDQYKGLTQIRHDDPRYEKLHVKLLRGALAHLDRAQNATFRRIREQSGKPGFPRYRSFSRYVTIDILEPVPRMVRRCGDRIEVKVKGLPTITLRAKRELPDSQHLKSLRIVRRPTGVTVDLVYEVEKTSLLPCDHAVGIDMGVRKRMMLSTGERIAPRQKTDKDDKITRQHQRVSRCRKGSKTRRKQVRQLARMKRRQQVRNRNACHRITTDVVRRFGTIAVEKLNIKGMTRSASGTIENPGKKVAQKRGLNRSIQEQTWGLLRQQLAYKVEWTGRRYVEVPPAFTSQDCSVCGNRHDPGGSEIYRCPACELVIDRDVNAARNILRAGTLALA